MDTPKVEQQLLAVKAIAFDLYQQLEQQGQYIQLCQNTLQQVAQKLDVLPRPEGGIDIEQLISAVDLLVRKTPETISNNDAGVING